MEAYTEFAYVYDELMDTTPYGEWCDYIVEKIEKYGISKPERDEEDPLMQERNLVVDLGCGTGNLTELLYDRGYDLVGIDISEDMLEVASERREESGRNILYLNQDMRELDLFCTAGTFVSVCDSVNYLLTDEDIRKAFSKVSLFAYPGALFIFDFNTEYKYRCVIGDSTIAENREDVSFIWENSYDTKTRINTYFLTLFTEKENGLYEKSEETHLQRGYELSEMENFVKEAGFEIIEVCDSDTKTAPTDTSERICIVARKKER